MHKQLIADHATGADGKPRVHMLIAMPDGEYTPAELRAYARALRSIANDSDQGATGIQRYPVGGATPCL